MQYRRKLFGALNFCLFCLLSLILSFLPFISYTDKRNVYGNLGEILIKASYYVSKFLDDKLG